MFSAALMSRSWCDPQEVQVHDRTLTDERAHGVLMIFGGPGGRVQAGVHGYRFRLSRVVVATPPTTST